MLNYNELSKRFDDLLASKTKEEIESWLKMDELREEAHEEKIRLKNTEKQLSERVAQYKSKAEEGDLDILFTSQIATDGRFDTEVLKCLAASESNYAMAA